MLLSGQQPIFRWLWNSFAAATLQTLLILATATMAAYALARLDFAGKKIVFGLIIATLLVPPVVFPIPNYLTVENFGWLDTILAITVPGAAGAFGVFFLRQFFLGLPIEVEEAARIDGAGEFRHLLPGRAGPRPPRAGDVGGAVVPRELERLLWPACPALPGEHDAPAPAFGDAAGCVPHPLRDRHLGGARLIALVPVADPVRPGP